jgi:palmitoyltransferase
MTAAECSSTYPAQKQTKPKPKPARTLPPTMLDPRLSRLAVAGVVLLICFLAYASQLFLLHPHLSRNQTIFFNALVGCIWITYARSILTHPGSPPKSWVPEDASVDGEDAEEGRGRAEKRRLVARGAKWCRRCAAFKPPRCHHCKTCKTYHCPSHPATSSC